MTETCGLHLVCGNWLSRDLDENVIFHFLGPEHRLPEKAFIVSLGIYVILQREQARLEKVKMRSHRA